MVRTGATAYANSAPFGQGRGVWHNPGRQRGWDLDGIVFLDNRSGLPNKSAHPRNYRHSTFIHKVKDRFLERRIWAMIGQSTRFPSRVVEPTHDPRGQRSDRGDEPRVTAPRVRRCATAWERGLTVVSGKGRASAAGMSGSAFLPERKFSALQGLENSQNAEGISILCEPGPGLAETASAEDERRDARSALLTIRGFSIRHERRRRSTAGSVAIADPRRRRGVGETEGETFPPRKGLKTHKTGKEFRFCASPFRGVPLG